MFFYFSVSVLEYRQLVKPTRKSMLLFIYKLCDTPCSSTLTKSTMIETSNLRMVSFTSIFTRAQQNRSHSQFQMNIKLLLPFKEVGLVFLLQNQLTFIKILFWPLFVLFLLNSGNLIDVKVLTLLKKFLRLTYKAGQNNRCQHFCLQTSLIVIQFFIIELVFNVNKKLSQFST